MSPKDSRRSAPGPRASPTADVSAPGQGGAWGRRSRPERGLAGHRGCLPALDRLLHSRLPVTARQPARLRATPAQLPRPRGRRRGHGSPLPVAVGPGRLPAARPARATRSRRRGGPQRAVLPPHALSMCYNWSNNQQKFSFDRCDCCLSKILFSTSKR